MYECTKVLMDNDMCVQKCSTIVPFQLLSNIRHDAHNISKYYHQHLSVVDTILQLHPSDRFSSHHVAKHVQCWHIHPLLQYQP